MNGNSFFCNLPSVTMCTLIVADDLSEYALTTLKGIATNLWIVWILKVFLFFFLKIYFFYYKTNVIVLWHINNWQSSPWDLDSREQQRKIKNCTIAVSRFLPWNCFHRDKKLRTQITFKESLQQFLWFLKHTWSNTVQFY